MPSVSLVQPLPMSKDTRPSYIADSLGLPSGVPHGYHVDDDEPTFDPAVHLQLSLPSTVHTSDFKRCAFPYTREDAQDFSLGYTEPFRLLSDEGVRVLRGIVAKNEVHAKSNERIPKCLRGLGYRSKFVREFTYHPEVLSLMARLAGKPIGPHGMPMNIAHTNFGKRIVQSEGKPPVIVDQWHVDSVDYVCVLILSDLSETVGGKLEVLHKHGVRDNSQLMQGGVTKEMQHLVRGVEYPGAGYCILMQGSQILHRVSPVLAANVPRMSCVTSYQSLDVFDTDASRYHTFREWDGEGVASVEYARLQAWRIRGQMDYLVEKAEFGKQSAADLAKMLRNSAAILEQSARLLTREEEDRLEFIDHEKVQSKL